MSPRAAAMSGAVSNVFSERKPSAMSNPKKDAIIDEPGAEDRFLRGVRKAVTTPPKPFTPPAKDKVQKDRGGKDG